MNTVDWAHTWNMIAFIALAIQPALTLALARIRNRRGRR